VSPNYGAMLASSVTATFVPTATTKVEATTIEVAHEVSL